MRRGLIALAAVAAAGVPASPAAAEGVLVTMPGKYFEPGRVSAVAGDTVTWRNTDFTDHDIRGQGGTFDSGRLGPNMSFSQRFDQPGAYPFLCTLHPFMSGQLTVAAAVLIGPDEPQLSGEPVDLMGRGRAGTTHVTIEHAAPGGAFGPIATAMAHEDGSFHARVTPVETGDYRAVTSAGASSPVTVRVLPRLDVRVTLHRGERTDRLRAKVTPAAPRGAVARLEVYVRERFDWRPRARAAFDDRGRTSFALPAGLRLRARVVVLRRRGGQELAVSRRVKLWR